MAEIISSILVFLEGLGYWGVMLGLMIEIIPSEIVLSYAGYLVYKGQIGYLGAVFLERLGEFWPNYSFIGSAVMGAVRYWRSSENIF